MAGGWADAEGFGDWTGDGRGAAFALSVARDTGGGYGYANAASLAASS